MSTKTETVRERERERFSTFGYLKLHVTNCTTRKPLFHDPCELCWSPLFSYWSVVSGQWSVVSGHWSLVTGHWPLFTVPVRSLLKALLHNQYGSYESCQAIHGSYLFQRIGNIWMVMLVCIKRTITAKSKVPILRFIVIQKGHCISLAGCGIFLILQVPESFVFWVTWD